MLFPRHMVGRGAGIAGHVAVSKYGDHLPL
jgi:hypothetical protein